MPSDIDAIVIANTRLSDDYSVLALSAPEIAAAAQPGQFVMVKPSRGMDPLLRRPFSIFEVLRDASGTPTAITLLNKRVGVGTTLLYEVEPGARVACLGPLGRPFEPVDPPAEAWMIAGGVGLAPFATLAEALRVRGTKTTLFYGARRASELYYVEFFEKLGVHVVLTTEDGSRGVKGFVTEPLRQALEHLDASAQKTRADIGTTAGSPVQLYVCGPTPMMKAVARLAEGSGRACDVSLEQVMGCGLGGCYSCVVLARESGSGPAHFVRSCIEGPVFDSRRIVWDALTH
jgi:dihydroorotate dehydrogenase electron transfer subunit